MTIGTETCIRTLGDEPPEDSLPNPKNVTEDKMATILIASQPNQWKQFYCHAIQTHTHTQLTPYTIASVRYSSSQSKGQTNRFPRRSKKGFKILQPPFPMICLIKDLFYCRYASTLGLRLGPFIVVLCLHGSQIDSVYLI